MARNTNDIRKKYTPEQIHSMLENVRKELSTYNYTRQHGRAGVQSEDEYDEYLRLNNNLVSRKARAKRKMLEQKAEQVFEESLGLKRDEDLYGIRPVDERRYRATFKSGYIGAPVYVSYIKRMTGLNLKQMYILQERTGLIPTPRIKQSTADADWKARYERGDIY